MEGGHISIVGCVRSRSGNELAEKSPTEVCRDQDGEGEPIARSKKKGTPEIKLSLRLGDDRTRSEE